MLHAKNPLRHRVSAEDIAGNDAGGSGAAQVGDVGWENGIAVVDLPITREEAD